MQSKKSQFELIDEEKEKGKITKCIYICRNCNNICYAPKNRYPSCGCKRCRATTRGGHRCKNKVFLERLCYNHYVQKKDKSTGGN